MSQAEMILAGDEGDTRRISFTSDALNDTGATRRVSELLMELIGDDPSRSLHGSQLTLDFGRIDRISSVGLNQLIGINSHARSSGLRLVLLNVQDSVRDIFALTRLERMFEFESERVEA